jgi:hypothetical protein
VSVVPEVSAAKIAPEDLTQVENPEHGRRTPLANEQTHHRLGLRATHEPLKSGHAAGRQYPRVMQAATVAHQAKKLRLIVPAEAP